MASITRFAMLGGEWNLRRVTRLLAPLAVIVVVAGLDLSVSALTDDVALLAVEVLHVERSSVAEPAAG